ncbi:hypothetical protein F4820DRAFT_443476 [Hypoxylon rubiginosum]|uniref:Uncharacterized protein n=1 Tax=Hypoxylon rubiginosum TaxID=110542 RepID=A0ACB9ZE23_9PEZI|nr:hypothetical protein F4820DRAFT_443476 [Hypoxylon rubiginosum]
MNPLQPRANHQFNPFEPHPELDGVEVPDPGDWVSNSDPFGMFAARGMAPPKIPPPSEVRREAKDRSTNIFAYHEKLQSILERHEATIQKRWEKKTRTQRLGILLQAWPGMPLTHRPDFAAFRKHAANLNKVAIQHRSSFIWPIINQEDLGDPKTLTLLLNSRGRNPPHLFAASDGEGMHLGRVTMAIVPIFLNEYVMTLNGMTRQEDYGRLIAWDENEDAFDWMHNRKQFIPGEGLLILEFQERLLEFLVDCCKNILHDIPLDRMTSNEFVIQPEPPLKESLDAAGFSTLGIMATEAPYRPPAKLDLRKIESLLSARTVRAEDHIWSLREDPSYFAETILDMKEHLLGIHSTTKLQRDDLAWARAISSVLVESFFQLETFAELRNQATHLRGLSRKYGPGLSPEKDLPEEYLAALLRFRHYLNQVTKGVLSQLKLSVAASPPLRSFFVQNVPISTKSSMIRVMPNSAMKRDKAATQLIWLLQTLWEDGHDLFLCRMTAVIDELDRLLKAEPRALELVSPYIAMLISELSITGECLRQLEIFQPWANGFEGALVDREAGIKKEFAEHTKVWAQIYDAFKEQNIIAIQQLGDPSGGKFQYPVGKRRNKANIETLRRSEANLDAFWNAADDILYRKAGSINGTAYKQVLSLPRYLQRTPEWVEPAAKKEEKSNHNHHQQNNGSYEYVSPSSWLLQGTGTTSSARAEALASGAGKTKVKRRGMPGSEPTSENDIAPPPPGSLADPQPTFKVDARALKVFRNVFFDPAANTSAGEVAWRDFLHAMDSTGFTAQKLYGSVWHFQPTRLDVERSIQFHEPHPRGKIPFLVARRHGRRLSRAYGWHGAMFVLKDSN